MWSLRIALARFRPWNASSVLRTLIVAVVVGLFLIGDFGLFWRLFDAIAGVERKTPLFALVLLRNLLSLVFLVATVILFSSSLTTAIGSYFTDLDLDLYHAAPRSRLRVAVTRWVKTLVQSATVVYVFLIPLLIAYARQYHATPTLSVAVLVNLALLLTIPVSFASTAILLLVRWFPVRRVHQIVATLAVLVLTLVVVAFRMSRPERFFTFAEGSSADLAQVIGAIELPAMSVYPSTAIAELMTRPGLPLLSPRIAITAVAAFALFALLARSWYFAAFVRARGTMAPLAIGADSATSLLDRLFARADPPLRAMIGKEVRTVGRDVAQWSQIFLMGALLFIYLYNIRMLPLADDARATFVAYANLGMSGFVVAAICLRFAYPSVSAEGKAFWIIESAPVSYRTFLLVKVFVYAAPLTLFSLLLTAFANLILHASLPVWAFTLAGASLLAFTLVSLGVGMGAFAPDFNAENPLQVGLSLGGFAYMAAALTYVTVMMILSARPVMAWFQKKFLGLDVTPAGAVLPMLAALALSLLLSAIVLAVAERRLARVKSD